MRLKAIVRLYKSSNSSHQDDVWYRFNMHCASLLVNSRALNEFYLILKDVVVDLLNELQNSDVLKSFARLWKIIHHMGGKENVFDVQDD